MMSQDWVTKMASIAEEAAAVVGREPEDDARDAWTLKYVARFVEKGISLAQALEIYAAGISDHDYDSDPESSADVEMSYWDNDESGEMP